MASKKLPKHVEQLIRIYRNAQQSLIDTIVKKEARGNVTWYQRSLLKQVDGQIVELEKQAKEWVETNIPKDYQKGVEYTNTQLKQMGLKVSGEGVFSKLHKNAVEILAQNAFDDLHDANLLVGRRIKDATRKAGIGAISKKLSTGQTVRECKRNLVDSLVKEGINGIKDKKGRLISLDAYAETVARSTTREATNQATLNQLTDSGYDLVKISSHASPCHICAPLEGRVYSISGKDKRYPPLEKAHSGGYANIHPNCFIDAQVPILTSKGWNRIGKIKIGDKVLTHNGRYKKVTYLHRNQGRPNIIKIQVAGLKSTQWARLTITEGHPVLVNGAWTPAEKIKEGDKIRMLAHPCEECGILTPLYRKTCCKSCEMKSVIKKRDTAEYRAKLSKSSRERMNYLYSKGLIDINKRTQKAHEATRRMVRNGTHPFLKKENNKKAQKKNGQINYGKSSLEKTLGAYLKNGLGIDVISQYRVCKPGNDSMGRQRYYFIDFAIEDRKIAIECDCSYWHTKKAREDIRKKDLENQGWTVISFDEKQINNSLVECGNEVLRILANHNHEYMFIDAEVTRVTIQPPKRTYALFNLSVEEDESYIAKGFVVHNCKHVCMPYIEDLADNPERDREFSNRPFDIDPRSKKEIDRYNKGQKLKRQLRADRHQWERYKMLLPEDTPGTFSAFRRIKNSNSGKWQDLQSTYRSVMQKDRYLRKNIIPEEEIKKAITDYDSFIDDFIKWNGKNRKDADIFLNKVLDSREKQLYNEMFLENGGWYPTFTGKGFNVLQLISRTFSHNKGKLRNPLATKKYIDMFNDDDIRVIKSMYMKQKLVTQKVLNNKAQNGKMKLYRGVEGSKFAEAHTSGSGQYDFDSLSSWTDDVKIAQDFGDYVIVEEVDINNVLVMHDSVMDATHVNVLAEKFIAGEKEYIVEGYAKEIELKKGKNFFGKDEL